MLFFPVGPFLSMECLSELLDDPHSSLPLIRTTSAQRIRPASSFSLSSDDDGLGLSDSTSPELSISPFASPTPTEMVGELSRGVYADSEGTKSSVMYEEFVGTRRKSSGSSDELAGDSRKSSVTSDEFNSDRRKSSDKSNTSLVQLPLVSQSEPAGTSASTKKSQRRATANKLSVDEGSSRKASTESIPAEEPQRRRSRRRASRVLLFAMATADKTMHVPSLLERYQVCSLACCSTLNTCAPLRELIMTAPRNTEGQNYKLSYEREPQ